MARTELTLSSDVAKNYPRKFNKRELKMIEAIQNDNNIAETFDCQLHWSLVELDGATIFDGTMAAGDEFLARTERNQFRFHVQSVNGTVATLFPVTSADGLELATDANATDGVLGWEVTNGISSWDKAAYTVGSFPSGKTVYAEATIKIDDVSDATSMGFGFRKAEAFNAAIADYTDFAIITKDGSENIDIDHDLNDSGTATSTDTGLNWADGESYTLRVEVTDDGVCKFTIDGTEYLSSSGFTFDSGDTIIPFLHLVAETGDPGVSVSSWKCGVK